MTDEIKKTLIYNSLFVYIEDKPYEKIKCVNYDVHSNNALWETLKIKLRNLICLNVVCLAVRTRLCSVPK